MDPIGVLVVAGYVLVIGAGAWMGRQRRREHAEAWQLAAHRLGATPAGSPERGFVVRRGPLAIEAKVMAELGARRRTTRVWARAAVRPHPRYSVGLPRRGLQPVALGPATTPAWADRPSWLVARWTPALARWWSQVAATRLTSNGQEVEVLMARVVDNPSDLEAAVELVAALAGDDLGAQAAFVAVPGAAPVPGRLAVRVGPDDILIEVEHVRGVARTVITGGTLHAPRARLRGAHQLEAARLPWVSAHVLHALASSGPAELAWAPGAAQLAWPHLELEPGRLRAAVEVVRAAISADSAAPYR